MLTPAQRDLLMFIDAAIKATGSSPTYEQMSKWLESKSKSQAHGMVTALVDRGFVARHPRGRHGLTVLRLPGQESIIAELIEALEQCIDDPIGTAAMDFRQQREIVARARNLTSTERAP